MARGKKVQKPDGGEEERKDKTRTKRSEYSRSLLVCDKPSKKGDVSESARIGGVTVTWTSNNERKKGRDEEEQAQQYQKNCGLRRRP